MNPRRLAVVFAFVAAVSTTAFAVEPRVELHSIVSGLQHPVAITHAGDARLFITLQEGRVVIYDGVRVLPTPFLDLSSQISTGGERGLLSVAFHPRYRENGFFFVNYTDPAGNTVIARYRVSSTDPNRADPTTGTPILRVTQPYANHNGGQLQFGPDGYLYIGMGDGGSAGDPGNRAQNLSELLGKMLRIDVDAATYAIPPSNPFLGTPGVRAEIWASGLRNPWRFTFDRATGDLWIADVGQGAREEINFQPATSIGGENYGWHIMEGRNCYEPPSNCNTNSLVLPVLDYGHDNNACSVTGGYRYRGARYPRLRGMYIYGDYCNGMIWGLNETANGGWTPKLLTDANFSISTFGEDVNGELYVASYNGTIYAIVDAQPLGPKLRSVRH
ncbi:MAG TPA: PQQ-dependent sugar dehydrogenase [Thermoanaerobaculia bacterium]|nr:PQQ-dependent sugar dehydrogenase [Thermoanaerobaculia bacterium]